MKYIELKPKNMRSILSEIRYSNHYMERVNGKYYRIIFNDDCILATEQKYDGIQDRYRDIGKIYQVKYYVYDDNLKFILMLALQFSDLQVYLTRDFDRRVFDYFMTNLQVRKRREK